MPRATISAFGCLADDASRAPSKGIATSCGDSEVWGVARVLDLRRYDMTVPGSATSGQRLCAEIDALVRAGEWAAYGDVGFVAYGNYHSGQAAGTAIAKYSNERGVRTLRYDGTVSPHFEWTFENGATPGPEVQRVLLEREGVRFTNGHADPNQQVSALMLLTRSVQAGLLTLKQMHERIASQLSGATQVSNEWFTRAKPGTAPALAASDEEMAP